MGRIAGTLAALSLAIALGGCGSSSETSSEEPALPQAVASSLADKADEIALALENGDQCGAAQLADELKDGVEAAISGGQVPAALRSELERSATKLATEVNCEEPKEEHGNKDEKKGDEDEGTTTLETSTDTTTTTTTTAATTTTTEAGG